MNKARDKIFFALFIAVWGVLAVWNLFAPKTDFSEYENRYLKVFPKFSVDTLINGKFADDVNTYLSDHFAGRHYWVSAQSLMEYGTGKRKVNGIYLGKTALIGEVVPPDADTTEKNIEGINAFARKYNMPIYVTLVPGAASIQPQNLPFLASGWDEEAYIASVNSRLSGAVTTVDTYSDLRSHSGEYIYYRTDHHWTSYGAFLACERIRAAMGLDARSRQDYERSTVSEDFYGTYHSKTGFPLVMSDTIERYQSGEAAEFTVYDGKETKSYPSIYFDEFLNKKDKYSYFLGQVQPCITIRTASDSDKRLIVFKDSYAHSLVPMLLQDFSEIRLVDLRFINMADMDTLLEISEYDEALFLYSTDVFSHQLGTAKLMF